LGEEIPVPGVRFNTEITRRAWLRIVSGGALGFLATRAIACVGESNAMSDDEVDPETTAMPLEGGSGASDAHPPTTSDAQSQADAAAIVDAHGGDADATAFVVLYDTYAQALYLDGTYGPKTGIIRVVDIAAGSDKVYDFWHGHGGQLHRFTLTAVHFATLKQKKRVSVTTTIVDSHQHTLFVDPVDPMWRVPGAQPIKVPV
jgi:hypothetical protein